MTFKVLTIALLTVCAAENRLLVPKRVTSHALPAQRLNKNNFLYTYGEGHQYSTPNSMTRTGPLIPDIYQRIQYAPLHGQIGQKNKNTAAEYTKVLPTLSSASLTPTEVNLQKKTKFYRKDHLEPRIPSSQATPPDTVFKCYSPEHNIEIKPLVSRSPGHNAVYRNLPDVIPAIKSFKADNIRPNVVYPNLELLSSTVLPLDLPHKKPARPFSLINEHYLLNPNTVEESPIMEKKKRQYSPYAKLHRLHLNIARVYSPGQVPQKSPVFADTYAVNYGSLSGHSEEYIPPLFEGLPDQKTILYPISNHKNYRFHIP